MNTFGRLHWEFFIEVNHTLYCKVIFKVVCIHCHHQTSNLSHLSLQRMYFFFWYFHEFIKCIHSRSDPILKYLEDISNMLFFFFFKLEVFSAYVFWDSIHPILSALLWGISFKQSQLNFHIETRSLLIMQKNLFSSLGWLCNYTTFSLVPLSQFIFQ